MNSKLLFIILMGCSPSILLVLHIACSRLILAFKINISSSTVALLSMLGGLGLTFFFAWNLHLRLVKNETELFYGSAYTALVYGCLAYAYLHLFLMGETARRLHILYELKMHGKMSRDQIAARYGAENMLSVRLERLLALQQIELHENRYVLRKKFLYLASRLLMAWGNLIGFRSQVLE